MQAEYQLKQRIMEEFEILKLTKAINEANDFATNYVRERMRLYAVDPKSSKTSAQ